jgi:hypothetical protein
MAMLLNLECMSRVEYFCSSRRCQPPTRPQSRHAGAPAAGADAHRTGTNGANRVARVISSFPGLSGRTFGT